MLDLFVLISYCVYVCVRGDFCPVYCCARDHRFAGEASCGLHCSDTSMSTPWNFSIGRGFLYHHCLPPSGFLCFTFFCSMDRGHEDGLVTWWLKMAKVFDANGWCQMLGKILADLLPLPD